MISKSKEILGIIDIENLNHIACVDNQTIKKKVHLYRGRGGWGMAKDIEYHGRAVRPQILLHSSNTITLSILQICSGFWMTIIPIVLIQ